LQDDGSTIPASGPRSSEQQRQKRERRALARQQRQQQQQQQQQCIAAAGADCAASPPPPSTSDTDILDHIIVACDTELLPCPHEHQQHKQQQQQKQQETAASSSSSSDSCSSSSSDSSGSGQIHACVMLDPIYRDGEVVGYFVQRTFLSPRGPKGAPKLVLKEVLGLLKAEGRSILNHGPAAAHNVKPGVETARASSDLMTASQATSCFSEQRVFGGAPRLSQFAFHMFLEHNHMWQSLVRPAS